MTNPDTRPEPILVDVFEGEKVRYHRAKLPAINLEMEEGYPRGTHLNLNVQVRVRSVRYEEIIAKENRGELTREHALVIEEVSLGGALTAEEVNPGVGGSASRQVQEVDDFGEQSQACYYDAGELQLVHRGTCDVCYRRTPWYGQFQESPVTTEDFLEAAGYTSPELKFDPPTFDYASREHDPGF